MLKAEFVRAASRAVGLVLVLLVVIAVRVALSSRAELAQGEELSARGDVEASVAHYRRAARWYVPFGPSNEAALDALERIGHDAETAGDLQLALSAYRSIRAASLGSRSFYVPYADRLHAADEHIASLMARLPPPPIDAGTTEDERRDAHLALLEAPVGPSPWWSIVALVGLGTWVASAFLFATRAFGDDDRLVGREARRWGTLFLVGLCMFVLGLGLA
jgi:hypothetical protein